MPFTLEFAWMELAKIVHSMLHTQSEGMPPEGGTPHELKDRLSTVMASVDEMVAQPLATAVEVVDKVTDGMAHEIVNDVAKDMAKDVKADEATPPASPTQPVAPLTGAKAYDADAGEEH